MLRKNEPRLYDQTREMLRHLEDPYRLSSNGLVIRLLGSAKTMKPEELVCRVRHLVESAAARLPNRLRTIVIRCDLSAELHSSVAASLGITERHFYRERRRATMLLGDLLCDEPAAPLERHVQDPDLLTLPFSYAETLCNAGNVDAAISVLESAIATNLAPSDVIRAYSVLANLCCDAGRFAQVSVYLARARGATAQSTAGAVDDAVMASEISLVEAKSAFRAGAPARAEALAHRAILNLRCLENTLAGRGRIGECITASLLLLSELQVYRGAFATALGLAFEARDEAERHSVVHPPLRVAILFRIAHARLYISGSLSRALFELTQAYEAALMHSLPREAVRVAWMFVPIQFWRGNPERALQWSEVALPIGLKMCSESDLASMFIDVATAHALRGDIASTRMTLLRANPHLHANPAAGGIAQLLYAETCLTQRDFTQALVAAKQGERILAREVPGQRFIGSAFRVQAEAIEGLGEHRAACARIGESLELLKNSGHPFSLMRAYESSARISRSHAHLHAASELRVLLSK